MGIIANHEFGQGRRSEIARNASADRTSAKTGSPSGLYVPRLKALIPECYRGINTDEKEEWTSEKHI